MSIYGITELYEGFPEYLKNNSKLIAPLQLTGRLEDYLVREFISHSYIKTEGEILGLANLGKGQRFDIALAKYLGEKKVEVVGLLEAKYLRNRHRVLPFDAKDETTSALKRLHEQLNGKLDIGLREFSVKLEPQSNRIFGLVFASYATTERRTTDKEEFYNRHIVENAKKERFVPAGNNPEFLDSVHEDAHVKFGNANFFVTLRVGLWISSAEIHISQ